VRSAYLIVLSLQLYPGEKIGFVGPNGSGKTTLLRLIQGDIEPDIGTINKRRSLSTGYLPQVPQLDPNKTAYDELYSTGADLQDLQDRIHAVAEQISISSGDQQHQLIQQHDQLHTRFELAGGYEFETRMNETIAGLGLEQRCLSLKTSELSGGQLSRLHLAKVLLLSPSLLLLDEPTNHLDFQATLWLERFLKNTHSAALIVSHDRYLLDRTATKIADVDNKQITIYPGNYTTYKAEKQIRLIEQQRQYESRSEFVKRTIDFVDRNRQKEGMSKVALGRKTRLDKLLKRNPGLLDKPSHQQFTDFDFKDVPRKTRRLQSVVMCDKLEKTYENLTLFKNLSFELQTADRLGIIGPNGTGKTTLLKILLGKQKPTQGKAALRKHLTVGYLDQYCTELESANTVIEELSALTPDWQAQKLRTFLGAFLFRGDDVFKKIDQLSGGEQNRLALAKLVLAAPDVLILDEPTNHLDIPTVETLEKALQNYNGTLIVVSHDRFFLDKTVDKILAVGVDEFGNKSMGSFEFVDGSFTDYLDIIERRVADAKRPSAKTRSKNSSASAGVTRAAKRPKREKKTKAAPAELKQFNKFSPEQIEQQIYDTEETIAQLHEKFGDENIYKQPELLKDLQSEFDDKKQYLDLLYRAYEHRSR